MRPMAVIGFAAIVAATMIGGCAKDPAVERQEEDALRAQDDAQCRAKGYEFGSRDYVQCMNYFATQRYEDRSRVAAGLRGQVPR